MSLQKPGVGDIVRRSDVFYFILDFPAPIEKNHDKVIRFRLKSLIPHDHQNDLIFFQTLESPKRFLVTLIKATEEKRETLARLSFNFPWRLNKRRPGVWVSRFSDGEERAVYDKDGLLRRIEFYPVGANRPELASEEPLLGSCDATKASEIPDFPGPRAMLQWSPGPQRVLWFSVAALLLLLILAQGASWLWLQTSVKQRELADLEARIEAQQADRDRSSSGQETPLFIHPHPASILKKLNSLWLSGYFLTRVHLKDDELQVEGWGPSALTLWQQIRKSSWSRALSLLNTRNADGVEYFVFSGRVSDD